MPDPICQIWCSTFLLLPPIPALLPPILQGEGFAELEWGILTMMGNIDPATTLVVTTVHDCQVWPKSLDDLVIASLALFIRWYKMFISSTL